MESSPIEKIPAYRKRAFGEQARLQTPSQIPCVLGRVFFFFHASWYLLFAMLVRHCITSSVRSRPWAKCCSSFCMTVSHSPLHYTQAPDQIFGSVSETQTTHIYLGMFAVVLGLSVNKAKGLESARPQQRE